LTVKSLLVALLVCACFMASIQAAEECPGCGERKGGNMTAAKFFAIALTNDPFRIALCEGFPIKPPAALNELYSAKSFGDYAKDSARCQFLRVVDPIRGHFDRLVVYHEWGVVLGRDWPAFNSPNFSPPADTQWIVVFREVRDGANIPFKNSEKKLPILHLANKDYGVIRYDAPNHFGLDAKEFLSDLKLLAQLTPGTEDVVLDQLKTDLGKETFAVMTDPAASGLQFDSQDLTLSAVADREEYRIGEEISISVSIKNTAEQKRQLFTSSIIRNTYAPVLYAGDGRRVAYAPDVDALPIPGPGLPRASQRITTIDPGTAATETVDLDKWFKIEEKGIYRLVLIRCVGPSWDDGFMVSNFVEFSVLE